MILDKLTTAELIHPPHWLPNNTIMLMKMGSQAYGVSNDDSDLDIYGVCMPPKELVFPHLAGEIPGFGNQIQRFNIWQEHHVKDPNGKVEYDFAVYSIVKFFQLCMENNPNMLDSLFVPRNCLIHSTHVAERIREQRKMFLHKGCWAKYKGYAFGQMHKIKNKSNASNPKRNASIQAHGYDLKFAYHIVRLLNEVEQILVEHDLDVQRNREQLKSIRRGEWTFEMLDEYFYSKEKSLEEVYAKSTLLHSPDEDKIKNLLMECMEAHYGNLSAAVVRVPQLDQLVRELGEMVKRYS
jgi:predicted nucleotidyltransferase